MSSLRCSVALPKHQNINIEIKMNYSEAEAASCAIVGFTCSLLSMASHLVI